MEARVFSKFYPISAIERRSQIPAAPAVIPLETSPWQVIRAYKQEALVGAALGLAGGFGIKYVFAAFLIIQILLGG